MKRCRRCIECHLPLYEQVGPVCLACLRYTARLHDQTIPVPIIDTEPAMRPTYVVDVLRLSAQWPLPPTGAWRRVLDVEYAHQSPLVTWFWDRPRSVKRPPIDRAGGRGVGCGT